MNYALGKENSPHVAINEISRTMNVYRGKMRTDIDNKIYFRLGEAVKYKIHESKT